AEDGIRDFHVTGVQTCALPIYPGSRRRGATDRARRWRSAPDTRARHRAGPRREDTHRRAPGWALHPPDSDAVDPLVWRRSHVLRNVPVDPLAPRRARVRRHQAGPGEHAVLPFNPRAGTRILQRGVARGTLGSEADPRRVSPRHRGQRIHVRQRWGWHRYGELGACVAVALAAFLLQPRSVGRRLYDYARALSDIRPRDRRRRL